MSQAPKSLPVVTREQAAKHNSRQSCWLVLFSSVYDVTAFLDKHPGGSKILLEYAGKDASEPFLKAGHMSYSYVIDLLARFRIGKLPADVPKL